MSDRSDNPLKRLIGEIHRRSLWQVLGIYAVGAWAALQVIDTLEGIVTLPEWFGGLAIGFLIASPRFSLHLIQLTSTRQQAAECFSRTAPQISTLTSSRISYSSADRR